MVSLRMLALAVFGLLLAGLQAEAAEQGFLSKLNPFAKRGGSQRATLLDGRPLIGEAHSARSTNASSSLWRRIGNGTKRLGAGAKRTLVKTKNFLTFRRKEKPPKPRWGVPTGSSSRKAKKSAKKPSFFSALFREEPPSRPRTVTEFLKQPRPGKF